MFFMLTEYWFSVSCRRSEGIFHPYNLIIIPHDFFQSAFQLFYGIGINLLGFIFSVVGAAIIIFAIAKREEEMLLFKSLFLIKSIDFNAEMMTFIYNNRNLSEERIVPNAYTLSKNNL